MCVFSGQLLHFLREPEIFWREATKYILRVWAMAGSNGTLLIAFRIVLFCAVASAATTLLPLVTRPCAYSLTRTILAATGGLDPHLISCADDGTNSNAQLSEGDGGNRPGSGGRPIVTDLRSCGEPDLPSHALPPFRCCPPPAPASDDTPVINFTFPDPGEPLRTRRPAHGACGADSVARYARAVALMKALPESDPRSFYQQANIHCAYCAGAYRQAGRPELPLQIHYSWLFFHFHRAYLYFFERVAARLLGDPGFAVPFWSWDVPEGMRVPPEFADVASPLFDPMRNPKHAPPRVVDLDFSYVDKNCTDEQQIQLNLRIMYKQMVTNAPLPSLFHGQPYRAGDRGMPGAGTVELSPHNIIHRWSGDLSRANHENMGAYYSAARDPIFYPHHANSDRLWEVWRSGGGGGHTDFTDPDWLDSSFLFYDEDARLVRVTVRDMLDVERLRYAYAEVGLPWLSARPPVFTAPDDDVKRRRGGQLPQLKSVGFPVSLDAAVTAEVIRRRTGKPRSQWREEVLVVDGIETDGAGFVKFDVYVNAVDHEKVGAGGREMAGSFVSLKHAGEVVVQSSMMVALNELLEDLGAAGDDSVTVTLVPVEGRVRIGGLRIVYMKE